MVETLALALENKDYELSYKSLEARVKALLYVGLFLFI
jgi:hypothetical protein